MEPPTPHGPGSRVQYDQQLHELQQDVLRMSSLVEQMLHKAMLAYIRREPGLIAEVMDLEDSVDKYDQDIETECLHLLALQNPMARDLRIIAAALKIITDVERIGDYCIDIAKMASRMADKSPVHPPADLSNMADIVSQMLRETLQAFVTRDLQLVHDMIDHDDAVDRYNRMIIAEMIEHIKSDSSIAEQAIAHIMVARYLERIADHVTNVGERVFYLETGEHKELHV